MRTICLMAIAAVSLNRCQGGPPTGEGREPQVEFTVVGMLEEAESPPVAIDSVSPGEVVLTGGLGTPTPCYAIGAEVALRERTLVLTLNATAQPIVCIQMLAAFEYRARIHGLSKGRYTLEVVTTYPGTGWASRVERLTVEIP